MKLTYMKDMNEEQLTKVFEANNKLQELVQEDMMETEAHYIEEQLNFIKGAAAIERDSYGRFHIEPFAVWSSIRELEKGFTAMDNSIPLLNDEDAKAVKGMLTQGLVEFHNAKEEEDEEKAMELIETACNIMAQEFTNRLEETEDYDNQLRYFLDFFQEYRVDGREYFISEGSYVLYKNTVQSFE